MSNWWRYTCGVIGIASVFAMGCFLGIHDERQRQERMGSVGDKATDNVVKTAMVYVGLLQHRADSLQVVVDSLKRVNASDQLVVERLLGARDGTCPPLHSPW